MSTLTPTDEAADRRRKGDTAEAEGRPAQAAMLRAEADALDNRHERGDGSDDTPAVDATRDLGHAKTLAELFRDKYRWTAHLGRWREWSGRVWREVDEERVATRAAEGLRRHYALLLKDCKDKDEIQRLHGLLGEVCLYARIIGALSFLKGFDGFYTQAEAWDADPWTLNVRNGELNLRTGELAGHDATHLHAMLAPVDFESGTAAAWTAHLERFLPNANVRRQVQRDLGVGLVGGTLQERLPIWFGTGANGKTTTARTLQKILGDYAKPAAPNLLISARHERHPTEIADLMGSRIVFSVEIGGGRKLDEAKVKELTGGDVLKARRMRQDFFSFPQTFSIFLLVNHHPRIADTDTGIWRRIALVPWSVSIPEGERRPQDDVVAELVAEGPAVLAWMLHGLRDWQAEPHWSAPEVSSATETYREEQDALAPFLEERCTKVGHYFTPTSELYAAYEDWAEQTQADPIPKTDFTKRLGEAGFTPERHGKSRVRGWLGIRLKDQEGESCEQGRTEADGTAALALRESNPGGKPETVSAGVRLDSETTTLEVKPDDFYVF